MRIANEKHSQNVNNRGNVPKTMVRKLCMENQKTKNVFSIFS